jgi:hypothetical protein
MPDYLQALFDTPKDQYLSVTLDVGIIPSGYPDAGKFVVTIQALPLPDRHSAEVIARALKEVIGSRLDLKFEEAQGNA